MAEIVDVAIDRERSLTVSYDDGVSMAFDLGDLREACPCATCRGRREQGRQARPPGPAPTIRDAEFVGAWGLSITWDDGHDTGIYAWDLLRRWHDEAGDESGEAASEETAP